MDKDLYSRTLEQLELETERYLRDYTLCDPDIDRYGFGKHILRMLLSGLAMHALGHFMPQPGEGSSAPDKPTTPGFQENEHPRESINAGQKHAGQFAPKPQHADESQAGQRGAGGPVKPPTMPQHPQASPHPAVRPLDPHTAAVAEKWHGSPQQKQAEFKAKVRAGVDHFDSTGQPIPAPPKATFPPKAPEPYKAPTNTAYNEHRPTPEQKAEALARQKQKDAGEFSRNYPDNINKPAQEQENYAPPDREAPAASRKWWQEENPEPVTLNPNIPGVTESAEVTSQDRHVEPTQEEIAALDNDPYNYDPEEAAPPATQPVLESKPAVPATLKPVQADDDERARQQAEARAKRNAAHAAKLAEQKAAQPTAAEKKAAAKRVEFDPTGWGDDEPSTPKESIAQVATRHGLEESDFHSHLDEMEKHDTEQWKKQRHLQAEVRKYIGSNTARRQAANEGKKGHEEYHDIADALSGNIPHEVLVEHFGHDTQDWDHKAYALANSPTLERPGKHDPEWVEKHAKDLANRMEAASQAPEYDYPEPEDGVPFSRKALTAEMDRYFYKAVQEYRRRNQSAVSRIWTGIARCQ